MCVNCLSQGEVVVAHVALAGALLKEPAHRGLAALGVVPHPDPVGRDVRTIAFLRDLDLDPVEVLGAETVERAERWVPAEAERAPQPVSAIFRSLFRSSASPMGSQSLLQAP
jgi:hypothetical protein